MAIDGGTTPHTAYMYEPFEGETEVKNYNRLSLEDLRRFFTTANELGWDVGIHCCGDHAQDLAVDAFAAAARAAPRSDARHSIIHAYFPTDHALAQMAKHNIAAVIQPTFIYWEGDLLFRDVGQRRAANYKPARDIPGSRRAPGRLLRRAEHGLGQPVRGALRAGHAQKQARPARRAPGGDQPAGGAAGLHASPVHDSTREERLKGTIEAGKLADLAVLDRDYFTVPDEQIKDVRVEMTVVGGKVVWERSA